MRINGILNRLKKYRFFSELITGESLTQFKKYIVIGLISFSLEYVFFYILYSCAKLWYITANVIVYIVVFWFNFLMNRYWSFKAKKNLSRQLMLYGMLFVFNLLAITGLMYLFSDIAGISPLISKVMVMEAVVLWNFILYKKVIYR